MVKDVLLIINRGAGVGQPTGIATRLRDELSRLLPAANVQTESVDSHADAKGAAHDFIATGGGPAAIIAGGGGGTLRAIIEAVCEGCNSGNLPGKERVCIAALRLGSGNVLTKQVGVPRDPFAALQGIAANLLAGRTAPCCVMRAELGTPGGPAIVRHAVTLGGLGQFGHIPGDLASWQRRWPALHRFLARIIGIERWTNLQYGLAMGIRSAKCILSPATAETVEVEALGKMESFRLFAGAVMNFPLRALPFDPGMGVEDAALSLHLIPLASRLTPFGVLAPRRLAQGARKILIGAAESVTIRLPQGGSAEFFLDEDPLIFHGQLVLSVAGTLAFVPGPEYVWTGSTANQEVTS